MKEELFMNIMDSIRRFHGLSRDCARMLIEKYPSVPRDVVYSIMSEAMMYAGMASAGKLRAANYFKLYKKAKESTNQTGIIIEMAIAKELPPALLAKKVLEDYCKESETKVPVGELMKDTTLIQDGDLAYEIFLCILHDEKYGYISDSVSTSVGYEYEVKLRHILDERNIAYSDENQLRETGYDKTPDFKLEVPIAVNGFVVNWIESKARFGSEGVHSKAAKDQYLTYWNRFGPGLVIYWFDFVDTLHRPEEKKFIIMKDFPENITYMDTKALRNPET